MAINKVAEWWELQFDKGDNAVNILEIFLAFTVLLAAM